MESNEGYSICGKLPAVKSNDGKTDMKLPDKEMESVKENYTHLTDTEKQTNSNQHNICNNNKNRISKTNKSDHNVVIDDAKQSQHQQQNVSYGCVHYKRQAKFVTPCCGKFFNCRHDENEDHHFDRKTLTELICTKCDTRQKVQAECEKCGVRFGKYTCLVCNLFDDEDKDQYHCDGCGICRIGGRNNFFHCEVCNMCLPLQLKTNGHRCVENISRSNCPVCLGDIHTSRYPCHIPDCGHLLHKTCFDQLLASGHYVCPTCQTSMIDMTKLWEYLDTQAQNLPVPKSHENSIVDIFCNDCFKNEASNNTMEDISTDEHSDFFIEITVSEPQKIGEGMGSYLAYKVTTHTSIPKFKAKQFSTLRRFSDFLGLHDLLMSKYLRAGRIIPPAPEKNLIGSTKVKMTAQTPTEPGNGSGMEWIEHRRAALERFLCRVVQHPILCLDADFMNFLQSNEELPRASNTAALSGAGVMRFFNRFGETVNKITYKMDENDPWFQDKICEIENLDTHFQKLHSALKSLVQHRRELSNLTGSVAKSAAILSTCEEHTGLSRALSQLADTEEKVELLRSEQANSDLFIFSEVIKDYLGLIAAIKDVFHERVKVFQNWEHSQMQLTKRRENKAKLDLANRTDKTDAAQKEIAEWEAKVQLCQQEFDEISKEIKKEMERFDTKRVTELKTVVIKYLEDQMAHQQQLVKYWDAFIPIAKEIV